MSTTIISATEAKSRFSELLTHVAESGTEFVITKHDRPVARLVPVTNTVSPTEAAEAVAQWRKQREECRLDGLKVKNLVNEGRA